MKGEWDTETRK